MSLNSISLLMRDAVFPPLQCKAYAFTMRRKLFVNNDGIVGEKNRRWKLNNEQNKQKFLKAQQLIDIKLKLWVQSTICRGAQCNYSKTLGEWSLIVSVTA